MTHTSRRLRQIAAAACVCAMPAVHAQTAREHPTAESATAADPAILLILPYALRLASDSPVWIDGRAATASSVLTADYRARSLRELAWREFHFGVHPADPSATGPYLLRETPVPGHPQLNFVQELRWPGGPLAGIAFERKNFLFEGDQLSIRSTSDVQALARGIGLPSSEAEAGMLSLLGWRSHSRLLWQWGEPTRELQWQFSASFDRRAAVQSANVSLQLVRRF